MILSVPERGSEEYVDIMDKIAAVFKEHIEPLERSRPNDDARHFVDEYEIFLDDFWTKQEAQTALGGLSRAIQYLCQAYEIVPNLIREDLVMEATGVDWERKERFQEQTTLDIEFKLSLPAPVSQEAVKALKTLVARKDGMFSTIDAIRKTLPEGIKTRNRPREAWAIIHAAVAVSDGGTRIRVPKAIYKSGPMYRLLRDLFDLFRINITVGGAYNGWRTHIYGKCENFDLKRD